MLPADLTRRRASSIADAVAIMTALEGALPQSDGLWWFNHLYLRVTRAVRGAVSSTTFQDPAFLERLDVVFANLYFDAVAAGDANAAAAPSAWRPLFECRRRQGLLSLQFALAGMNAHINRDLPAGIVSTHESLGGAPAPTGTRRADFEKVNDLLQAVEAEIKVEFATGIVALIDEAGGELDDAVAMWNVRVARDTAWTNAEVLWSLRDKPPLRDAFFTRLDKFTGFASRGLLVPVRSVRL